MTDVSPRRPRRNQRPEAAVMQAVLLAVGCRRDFRAWRNNVGLAEFPGAGGKRGSKRAASDRERKVRYGLHPGSGDLIGILTMPSGIGRFVSIEVKAPGKQPTDAQQHWADVIRGMGGFACTVHSGAETQEALDRALTGAAQ